MITSQTSSQLLIVVYILLFIAAYYFILVLPQRRKMQEKQRLVESLKVNDEVMTAGGIIGTIKDIKEDTITLQVADNVAIKFAKDAIVTNLSAAEATKQKGA
jgi:preprotein translocase subunit YajC